MLFGLFNVKYIHTAEQISEQTAAADSRSYINIYTVYIYIYIYICKLLRQPKLFSGRYCDVIWFCSHYCYCLPIIWPWWRQMFNQQHRFEILRGARMATVRKLTTEFEWGRGGAQVMIAASWKTVPIQHQLQSMSMNFHIATFFGNHRTSSESIVPPQAATLSRLPRRFGCRSAAWSP